jgi:hypothetical protein
LGTTVFPHQREEAGNETSAAAGLEEGIADTPPEGAIPLLAAAWKATNDFSLVGLTAKTIPALQ